MKAKSRLLKIFAVVFVTLFALACLASLAACGDDCEHEWDDGVVTKEATVDEEGEMTYTCTICGETKTETIDKLAYMTDDDVVALSAAVTKTLEYDDSYTCLVDMKAANEVDGLTGINNIKYSCDMSAGIEYMYDSEDWTYSTPVNYSKSYVAETYTFAKSSDDGYMCYEISDGVKSVYEVVFYTEPIENWLKYWNIFDIRYLSDISTVGELNDWMLENASGWDFFDLDNIEIKLAVSGDKYMMSAAADAGEFSVSVTVKDGMVANIYSDVDISFGENTIEGFSDMDISYSYDQSLASNFSDLSQWND